MKTYIMNPNVATHEAECQRKGCNGRTDNDKELFDILIGMKPLTKEQLIDLSAGVISRRPGFGTRGGTRDKAVLPGGTADQQISFWIRRDLLLEV